MKNRIKIWLGNQVLALQRAISHLGEKTGSQWLIYNPLVTHGFVRAARRNAPLVVDCILKTLPKPSTVADYGCGPGIYVEEFKKAGVEAVGYEYNERYQTMGRSKQLTIYPWDIADPDKNGLNIQKYDLIVCLEVAEHVPAFLAEELVRILTSSARMIVFTAAHPGQGGTGHINEQPRQYWIEKFIAAGASYNEEITVELARKFREQGTFDYLPKNLSVFMTE